MHGVSFVCQNLGMGWYRHIVSRGQGCYQTWYNAQDKTIPHPPHAQQRIIHPKMSVMPRLRGWGPLLPTWSITNNCILTSRTWHTPSLFQSFANVFTCVWNSLSPPLTPTSRFAQLHITYFDDLGLNITLFRMPILILPCLYYTFLEYAPVAISSSYTHLL